MILKLLKKYLKLGALLFGVVVLFTTCEKDNFTEEETHETINEESLISIKTISISEADETFNKLKNKYQLDNHFGLQLTGNTLFRAEEETENVGIIIYTDKIKEITKDDYISYTMLIKSLDLDPKTFYNITIEYKEGVEGMFVTQYKKANEGSINKISTKRINDLQETIGKEDFGNEDEETIGGGSGSGGNSVYPADCDGTVVPTTVWVNVPCGCGHQPGSTQHDFINGCDNAPQHPYWDLITTYECVGSDNSNPPDDTDPTTGNPNTSGPGGGSTGGSDGNNNNNPSLTSPIDKEEGSVSEESDNCKTLKDLRKTDSLSLNIKPIIEALKEKTTDNREWYQEVQRSFSTTAYKTYPVPGGIKPGIDRNTSKFSSGGFYIGVIHSHPKKTDPMFSWRDLRATRNLYRDVGTFGKEHVFNICVNHNGTVYALKVDNYEVLDAKIENDWANARGSNDKKKISNIEWELGQEYKNDENIERAFLREFKDYGISLYKAADDNISNWNKLELENPNSRNSDVIPTPCN